MVALLLLLCKELYVWVEQKIKRLWLGLKYYSVARFYMFSVSVIRYEVVEMVVIYQYDAKSSWAGSTHVITDYIAPGISVR